LQEFWWKRRTGNGHNIRKWGTRKGQKEDLVAIKRKESNLKAAATLCAFSAKNQRAIVRCLSHPLYTLSRRQQGVVVVTGSVCSENRRL
jgi:hypothetical protein